MCIRDRVPTVLLLLATYYRRDGDAVVGTFGPNVQLLYQVYVYVFFPPSHLLCSPFFFSLRSSRNSHQRSHGRLFDLPTTVRALNFLSREDLSPFSSLDTRQVYLALEAILLLLQYVVYESFYLSCIRYESWENLEIPPPKNGDLNIMLSAF